MHCPSSPTCPRCEGELELGAAFCGLCGSRTRRRANTLVGEILDGHYSVDRRLAEGGFGAVYQGTHLASGLDVALKVLHADLAADPNLAARFRREGATLARLHDPHTVATYGVGEAPDGTLYIAMELLHGESLHDRLGREGALPWRTALGIIREICSSLAEAHDLGVIHRDLKPANIHLLVGDAVKVLDFGIAKVADGQLDDGAELTRTGQMIGTLEYMAPEQAIGGSCDPRTDLYQLGVLAFEMVTGRRPFATGSDPTSVITALLTENAPVPSALVEIPRGGLPLPPSLDALILRCLERDPADRFANVRELITAISRVLARPTEPVQEVIVVGEDVTWIGGEPGLSRTIAAPRPRVTALGPSFAPCTTLAPAAFEIPVRGSGGLVPIGDPVVEPVAARASTAGSSGGPAPRSTRARARAPFALRVTMWTIGLAASGAALGAALAGLAV